MRIASRMAVSSSTTNTRNGIAHTSLHESGQCYPRTMQFDEVLRTFGEFFEREKIPYAVIGGLAMQAWGRPLHEGSRHRRASCPPSRDDINSLDDEPFTLP